MALIAVIGPLDYLLQPLSGATAGLAELPLVVL